MGHSVATEELEKPLLSVSVFSNIKNKKFDSLLTAKSPDQSLIGSKVQSDLKYNIQGVLNLDLTTIKYHHISW